MWQVLDAGSAADADEPRVVARRGIFVLDNGRPPAAEPEEPAPGRFRPQDPLRPLRLPYHQTPVKARGMAPLYGGLGAAKPYPSACCPWGLRVLSPPSRAVFWGLKLRPGRVSVQQCPLHVLNMRILGCLSFSLLSADAIEIHWLQSTRGEEQRVSCRDPAQLVHKRYHRIALQSVSV